MDILYTCTHVEGEMGQPSRKINLGNLDHSLLLIAYILSRSNFFDDPDVPERDLVLILGAIPPSLGSLPAEVHEQYRVDQLRGIGADVGEPDPEEQSPQWEVSIPVVGFSNAQVDAKICEVLQWHNEELKRLTLMLPEQS